MAAPDLVQALEGLSFPCDHDKLIEYARNAQVDEQALATLEELPARQYRDLAELLEALPEPAGWPEDFERLQQQMPQLWEQAWRQGILPLEMTSEMLRVSMEAWPHWMRLGQRFWFPRLR